MAAAATCRWCGAVHGPACPLVSALEFDADSGAVVRVEFFDPNRPEPPAAPAAPDYERLGERRS